MSRPSSGASATAGITSHFTPASTVVLPIFTSAEASAVETTPRPMEVALHTQSESRSGAGVGIESGGSGGGSKPRTTATVIRHADCHLRRQGHGTDLARDRGRPSGLTPCSMNLVRYLSGYKR